MVDIASVGGESYFVDENLAAQILNEDTAEQVRASAAGT
jgi:hypothetical protein